MKKAIQLSDNYCLNLDFLKKIKAYGYDGVDFSFSNTFRNRHNKEETLEQIIKNLHTTGLTCPQVHLPYYEIFTSSEIYDPDMEQYITYALTAMPKLGASWGALHPMSATNFGYNRKRAMEDNISHVQVYLETASKYNVGIAIENLPYFPDHKEAPFFTCYAQELRELVDHIDDPLVGICWDFGHAFLNIADEDCKLESFRTVADKVTIIHAHANPCNMDWHLVPSMGSINWQEQLPILFNSGFDGYFSLECNFWGHSQEIKEAYARFGAQAADILLKSVGK